VLGAEREMRQSILLASNHYNFTIMPIEERLHLTFRFILDALVGLEGGVAALATGERDWSQLNDLEFSFVHSRRKNDFRCLVQQRGAPRQEQLNARRCFRTSLKLKELTCLRYREIAADTSRAAVLITSLLSRASFAQCGP
jgi:hypothetical protein